MPPTIPNRFIDHIAHLIGDESAQSAFREAASSPLPRTLRANFKKQTQQEWQKMAQEIGLLIQPSAFAQGGYTLLPSRDPGRLLEHRMGYFYLQEMASMIPVEVLRRLAPEAKTVLDLCAAPGSKTTQLASSLSDAALIVANEPSRGRIKILVANLLRMGLGNVICTNLDGRNIGPVVTRHFDAVLVDAPCSGEGTIRKDKQALRGWHRKRFKKITRTQTELLQSGFQATAPGGVLVYSTCALSPEENQGVIASLMAKNSAQIAPLDLGEVMPELARSVTSEGFLWVAPHHYDTGGFFVAALRRKGSPGAALATVNEPNTRIEDDPVSSFLRDEYGFETRDLDGRFLQHNGMWLFQPRGAAEIECMLPLNRRGVKAATQQDGALAINQEFALVYGQAFTRNCVEVDRDQARHFLYGSEPDTNEELKTGCRILLRYRGQPLGFCRWESGRLRNLLGPSFVQQSVE